MLEECEQKHVLKVSIPINEKIKSFCKDQLKKSDVSAFSHWKIWGHFIVDR